MTRLRNLLFFCTLLVAVFPAWAGGSNDEGLSASEVSDLFSQAKRFFAEADALSQGDTVMAEADYRRSLLYLERIVEEGGVHNGKLFYDIGNVYVRLGDIGNAILNYLRAAKFISNDPNLIHNLDHARSKRVDSIETSERATITRILFFWHFDFSSQFRCSVFAASFMLIWVFAGLHLLFRKRFLLRIAAALCVVAALFLASLTWESMDARRNVAGVVLSSEVEGRKGNSDTYQPSFQEPLHAGTEFLLRETRGTWCRVELNDGRETWLPSEAVGVVAAGQLSPR